MYILDADRLDRSMRRVEGGIELLLRQVRVELAVRRRVETRGKRRQTQPRSDEPTSSGAVDEPATEAFHGVRVS